MAKVIFTPWKEQAQLLAVRSQFYPPPSYEGPDQRSSACSTVALWKLHGNLPHPVEATALLTEAILHDEASKHSIFSIRATYSAAFCRFVTGLVDSKLHGQRKTMFQRAIDLGLPASFVELRHEATHREPPSLIVLRNAVPRALEWLWDYYWSTIYPRIPVHDILSSSSSPVEAQAELSDAIEPIKRIIRDNLDLSLMDDQPQPQPLEPPRKRRKANQQQTDLAAQLSSVCRLSRHGALALSRVLIGDSILMPVGRRLGDSMDPTFCKWDHFLISVIEEHPQFMASLTDEMVNELAFTPPSSKAQESPVLESLVFWLDHILTSPAWRASRRLLSTSYIRTVCRESENRWTKSVEKCLQGDDEDYPGSELVRTRAKLMVASSSPSGRENAVNASIGTDEQGFLGKYGWAISEKWDGKPLGIS